jgi:hypothetical protein
LRATRTKLSQNLLLPTSANLLAPSCTARIAIAAVITAAACTAISTAVVLLSLSSAQSCCSAALCLHLSSQVPPFSSFLSLRCCRSSLSLCRSFAPYRLRLCPAPLSPFGPSCPEPRKTKLNRAWPRGPRCLPSPLLNQPPSLRRGSCH